MKHLVYVVPWVLVVILLGFSYAQYRENPSDRSVEVAKLKAYLTANIVVARDDAQFIEDLRKTGFDPDRPDLLEGKSEAALRQALKTMSSVFSHSSGVRNGILLPYVREEIRKRGEVPPSDQKRSDLL